MIHILTLPQNTKLSCCVFANIESHFSDFVQANGVQSAWRGGRLRRICAMWMHWSTSLPWRRTHTAVNAQVVRSTAARSVSGPYHAAARTPARASASRTAFGRGIRGRLAPPAASLMPPYRWRCLSISVSSDASNEVFDVKIVNTVNKITTDIAFERILCYNHAEREKKHAA